VTDRNLDAAGILDPRLRAVHTVGAKLFEEQAGGHYIARLLFPPPKRPYMETFWAFVLFVDNVVDDASTSVEARADRLDRWERMYASVIEGTPPEGEGDDLALARAFAHVLRTWGLPVDQVHRHIAAQRATLTTTQYDTEADLDDFVENVVLLPAEWVNTIFEADGPRAVELCRQTITGFQLLDRLWDIKDDLAAGKLSLPLDHLAKFDLDRAALTEQLATNNLGDRVKELFGYEIERARTHLARGRDWLGVLHPTSRAFMSLDMDRFTYVAERMERDDFEYFRQPTEAEGFDRSWILPRTWTALSDAALANNAAMKAGYRVPPPAEATWEAT
jgi:phytoene synthase